MRNLEQRKNGKKERKREHKESNEGIVTSKGKRKNPSKK